MLTVQINSGMAEQIEALKKTKENFGIKAKEKIDIDDKAMKEYHVRYRNFFDTLKTNLTWPQDPNAQDRKEKKRIAIKVKLDDNLQKLFDRFLELGEKDDTFLFRGLDYQCKIGFHNWKFFLDWNSALRSKLN